MNFISSTASKSNLRLEMKKRFNSSDPLGRQSYSAELCGELKRLIVGQGIGRVAAFYPMKDEVDIWPLLESLTGDGVRVYLPHVISGEEFELREYTGKASLVVGRFGIPEPQGASYDGPLDLVLVPGVAFDTEGNRLGRGRGYYDRFLRKIKKEIPGVKILGICFPYQISEEIPLGNGDEKVDSVILASSTSGPRSTQGIDQQ